MPFRNVKLRTTDQHATHICGENAVADDDERRIPICSKCKIEMLWFQSHLKRDNGKSRIIHSFYCSQCSNTATTEDPIRSLGPPKLNFNVR